MTAPDPSLCCDSGGGGARAARTSVYAETQGVGVPRFLHPGATDHRYVIA